MGGGEGEAEQDTGHKHHNGGDVNDREVLDRLDEYAHSLRDRMFDRSDKKAPYAHILSRQLGRTYDRMTEVAVRMAEDRFPHTPPAPTPPT
jgi:hypothetical protein